MRWPPRWRWPSPIPRAGNIGGGGFIVYRAADGTATTFDFREMAPAGANPTMWMKDGKYDFDIHHNSHRSVGVPGTVAGLHLAWQKLGSKPWKDLVLPAVALARDGFEVSEGLARSLAEMLVEPDDFKKYPASLAQFSKNGQPYQPGDILKQPDLARSLQRIADQGPAGFYEGETAALVEKEMKANNGLITREDLKNYRAKERAPIKGTYRGVEVIGMPPPSSGGIAVVHMLNLLEGFDLKANGYGSAQNLHLVAESMRRAFADRAQHLGDPDFNTSDPGGAAHLEGLRGPGAQDHQPEQGLGVVAVVVLLADRIPGDDPPVGGRREAQRRLDDLHAGVRLRLAHRRARRRLPPQQRDGRLQLRARR